MSLNLIQQQIERIDNEEINQNFFDEKYQKQYKQKNKFWTAGLYILAIGGVFLLLTFIFRLIGVE